MAEKNNRPTHEKRESSDSYGRHMKWESGAVVLLFPLFFFAALFDSDFE